MSPHLLIHSNRFTLSPIANDYDALAMPINVVAYDTEGNGKVVFTIEQQSLEALMDGINGFLKLCKLPAREAYEAVKEYYG